MTGTVNDLAHPSWLDDLGSRSEMGRLVADFDWASNPLGPVAAWPTELRVAVRMCLSTSFPMLIVWGDDLIKIYNDGYRMILGPEKHPRALGAPVRDIWPEIWDQIEPLFDSVISTGRPTLSVDEPLVIERNGAMDEAFFTFSYSPLYSDDGNVAGVVDIVTETTGAVVAQRRLGCLAAVSAALSSTGSVPDLALRAVGALAEWDDCLTDVDLYLVIDDALALVASSRRTSPELASIERPPDDGADDYVVLRRDPDRHDAVDEVAIPIGRHQGDDLALMVVKVNPLRPFDEGYEGFLGLLAESIGASLERAIRHAIEVDEYRTIGDVLQQAMIKPASDFSTVAARYLPATGNLAVGGDWYDVIELGEHRRALVVGDCVGHGLAAAAAMSQLRAASRSMLLQGLGPGAMLDGLDRYALSVDDAYCATAVCIVVDRAAGTLTYARAGHLPPLVVHEGRVTWLDRAGSVPLGVAEGHEHEEAIHMLHGDELVVMFSDGLVERRGEMIDDGLDRLATTVIAHEHESVHDIADAVVRDVLPREVDDDVVVVVKRMPPAHRGPATGGDE